MEKICSATYNYPSKEEYLKKARLVLQKYFGFNEFRPHQLDCIKKLWEHGSCFVLSPTGSGKSLCYTIPALLEKGLSLVISPLISLMDDQVINLKNKGILAERFHSNLGSEEKRKIIESIKDSKLKLLYISPERFARDDFRELLRKYHNIDLIAIDEAHCISDWGYFRSEYKNIGIYLKEFLEAKKILLTATLTQDKLEYIKSILDIKDIQVVNVNQIRTNLIIKNFGFYHEEEKIISLVRSLLEEKGSGIIYACTRKRVEETYEILTQKFRISCCKFHGGMSSEEKERSFHNFMENKIKIMIATKAFGMGIDKADIRFVYHINIPACLEDYFQEIGRAGRDGKDSNTFLFYTSKDLDIQKHMIDMSFPDKIILKRISSFINDLYNKEEEEEEEDRLEYKFIVCSIMNLFNLKDSYYIEKILELFIKNKIYILDESKTFIFKNKELTKKDLKKFYSYIKKEKLEHIYKLQKMVDYINLDTKSLKDKLYTNYFKIEDK